MAVRDVLRMGHPVLREKAKPVEDVGSDELKQLVLDMKETMAFKNGAGLAAPQIGVSQRVVIFGVDANPRYPDAEPVPFTVLVNPKLVMLTREVEEDWEGCLSVPGMRGVVPRFARIRYRGVDLEGRPIDREADGFHARVVQHACDHLIGKLYPMRIRDFSRFGFTSVLFPDLDAEVDD
ncbi:MAG TPA: peptide deformylase [Usitatibacter sp.]|nr:peptide deformylase [Usitatibacter sp.]